MECFYEIRTVQADIIHLISIMLLDTHNGIIHCIQLLLNTDGLIMDFFELKFCVVYFLPAKSENLIFRQS